MSNKSTFASNLRYYMDISGKTRKDIAAALGISYFTVSDWVNGKKYPRMDKVEMLADYFGVLKSDLIEDRAEKKPAADDGNEPKSVERLKLETLVRDMDEEQLDLAIAIVQSILDNRGASK